MDRQPQGELWAQVCEHCRTTKQTLTMEYVPDDLYMRAQELEHQEKADDEETEMKKHTSNR